MASPIAVVDESAPRSLDPQPLGHHAGETWNRLPTILAAQELVETADHLVIVLADHDRPHRVRSRNGDVRRENFAEIAEVVDGTRKHHRHLAAHCDQALQQRLVQARDEALVGSLGENHVQADRRGPQLGQGGEQLPVIRMPEIAWFAERSQRLHVDANDCDVPRHRPRRHLSQGLEARVQQLSIDESEPVGVITPIDVSANNQHGKRPDYLR